MNIPQLENGKLPAYAWPGGYPIIYLDRENSILCAECATKSHLDADEVPQYRPVACDVFYEGAPEECGQCGKQIESAYGDPDAEQENTMNHEYEVIVGNVGSVYAGPDKREAELRYNTYVDRSKSDRGRCAGEPVTLMCDGEISREYEGTLSTESEA